MMSTIKMKSQKKNEINKDTNNFQNKFLLNITNTILYQNNQNTFHRNSKRFGRNSPFINFSLKVFNFYGTL